MKPFRKRHSFLLRKFFRKVGMLEKVLRLTFGLLGLFHKIFDYFNDFFEKE